MESFDSAVDLSDPGVANGVALLYSEDVTPRSQRAVSPSFRRYISIPTTDGVHRDRCPVGALELMTRRYPEVERNTISFHSRSSTSPSSPMSTSARCGSTGRWRGRPGGHCKLDAFGGNLLFCIEHDVKYAADGAVFGNEYFAEQYPKILMPALIDFYGRFGITLLHPVYEKGLDTELALFELGITESRRVKRTAKDKQIICSQHIMFAASCGSTAKHSSTSTSRTTARTFRRRWTTSRS